MYFVLSCWAVQVRAKSDADWGKSPPFCSAFPGQESKHSRLCIGRVLRNPVGTRAEFGRGPVVGLSQVNLSTPAIYDLLALPQLLVYKTDGTDIFHT